MFARVLLCLCGLGFASIHSTVCAEDVLSLSGGGVQAVGSSADITVTLENSEEFISAFQFAVCDDALIDSGFGQVSAGAALGSVTLDTYSIDFGSDSWSVGAVLGGGDVFAIGELHELMVATYDLLEAGESTLDFCDSVLATKITTDTGGEITPTTVSTVITVSDEIQFLRGDVDGDGRVEPLIDVMYLGTYYFYSGPEPPCMEAADANDNGAISALQDSLFISNYFFGGGPAPASPGPTRCGGQPGGGDLGCLVQAAACPSEAPAVDLDDSATFELGFSAVTSHPGDPFDISVSLDFSGEPVQGLSVAVCNEEGISMESVGRGADGQAFRFVGGYGDATGWSGAVLVDFDPDSGMLTAGAHEMMLVTYRAEEIGEWKLEFCEEAGNPPVGNRVLRDLVFSEPLLGEPITIPVTGIHRLELTSAVGEPGAEVTSEVLFTNPSGLEAWQLAICDVDGGPSLEPGDVEEGTALAGLQFTAHIISVADEGWTAAAVLDLDSGGTLSPGIQQQAYVAHYKLPYEAGTWSLEFCTLGDPPVSNELTSDGEELVPELLNGSLTSRVENPFRFSVDVPLVVYDPNDPPDAIEFSVDFVVEEDPSNLGFPNKTSGIQIVVMHDPDVLHVDGVEALEPLTSMWGGDGPGFLGMELETFDQPLFVVLAFYGRSSGLSYVPAYLEFDEPKAVARASYSLTPAALAALDGDRDGIVTKLKFLDEVVGGVFWSNAVFLPEPAPEFQLPASEGRIRLAPPGVVAPFLRGDCNGNGAVVALSDALFLFRYGFSSGNEPPCLDAADVDDNGGVSAIIDGIALLYWAFGGGSPPASPGTERCGEDPTGDGVSCDLAPEVCE